MSYLKFIVLLLITYLALTGNFQPSNLVIGVLLAFGVAMLLRPRLRPLRLGRLPRVIWATMVYIGWLAVDIIRNGVTVARIVLTPSMPVSPCIIALPTQSSSGPGVALYAHAITVTPGELVVEMGEDNVLYVHCLQCPKLEKMLAVQKHREMLLERIVT